ncbi:cell wall hydrolase [Halomonas sp. MCCC 1A11036]|uniref:Cell wall hydrolase n=1 Tax=Billgrantia zhangzhouensis TaxID=2733481 RepID=A0ABS9AIL8_9GAMM|nr:cell wall hydrolase [Halomonas zhangzhouensis]MCE8021605.1 cell wall hydrolase [Halomonas zhangzhouensis]
MLPSRLIGWLLLSLPVVAVAVVNPAPQADEAARKAEILEQVAAPDVQVSEPVEPLDEQEAQVVDPEGSDPLEEPLTCLARTIYWEAKGVPGRDMESVANVVMNRLASEEFPNTICEVVRQGSEQSPCQFSWWCDGRPDEVMEGDAYEVAKEVARRALNQELPDHTDGALYFHDRTVHPPWANEFLLTAETEAFIFYRPDVTDAE